MKASIKKKTTYIEGFSQYSISYIVHVSFECIFETKDEEIVIKAIQELNNIFVSSMGINISSPIFSNTSLIKDETSHHLCAVAQGCKESINFSVIVHRYIRDIEKMQRWEEKNILQRDEERKKNYVSHLRKIFERENTVLVNLEKEVKEKKRQNLLSL